MFRLPPWIAYVGATSLALAGVLGCGGGGGGSGGSGGGGGGGGFGLTTRALVTRLTFPLSVPTPGSVDPIDAFPALTANFASPIFVAAAPGDNSRLFVVEQRGRIRVITNSTATTAYTTFLDITDRVTANMGEEGLLGFAFDPAYATNGRFYVNYITAGASPRDTVVSRFTRTSATTADPASEVVLLRFSQPYSNHNGGMLAFGPDGYLYVSTGDGGSAGDPGNRALDLGQVLGKILRIDVNTTAPPLAYGIPSTNPFVATAGARPEIFAYGLRNPWRFSFDRVSGALWCGDVGQGNREEIDLVTIGGNYGWKAREGTQVYSVPDLGRGPFIAPIHDYSHGTGSCVVGGYVYRGASVPFLYGAYVYADNGAGQVWALSTDGTSMTANVEITSLSGISSFGEDAAGELLICRHGTGRIQKLVPRVAGGGGAFPQTISASGIYADLSTLEPSEGLVPYDVNAPLWSDGASKDRYLALPGVGRMGFSENGAFSFPVGTVIVKTFRLPLVVGDASTAVKTETRVLLLTPGGWEGYSYRWRADQTDADLLTGADTRTFTVTDPAAPGGTFEQSWRFPSRGECTRCHTAAAGFVLGLTTRQLNRDFDYGAIVDNQLRSWDHIELFDTPLPDSSVLPAHPEVSNTSSPVAGRARAHLDANCAMCHRPGGPSAAAIDLRSTVSTSAMNVVGVTPQFGNVGLPSPFLVQSGNHANSVLWLRMHAFDANRMPPLASSVADLFGEALLAQWIDGGP